MLQGNTIDVGLRMPAADNRSAIRNRKSGDTVPHSGRLIVSVFGSNAPREGEPGYEEARALGRLLAQAGYIVATGGYAGTMEATSRGAKEAGGLVIGVTAAVVDGVRLGANPYL